MSSRVSSAHISKSPLNTIESSVTKLLVATKHLLESLTQWATGNASENDVSDAYVELGSNFKTVCRVFTNAGVDVTDLGDVPHLLRVVLENALREAPSQENLDRFLPGIRDIIVNLLRNLKKKQNIARKMQDTGEIQNQLLNNRHSTSKSHLSQSVHSSLQVSNSRSSSQAIPNSMAKQQRLDSYRALSEGSSRPVAKLQQQPNQQHQEQTSQNAAIPDLEKSVINKALPAVMADATESGEESDALKQLQQGDSLKRRASRRFSAYQYAKLTKQTEMPLPKDISSPEPSVKSDQLQLSYSNSIKKSSSLSPAIKNSDSVKSNVDMEGNAIIYLRINNRTKKISVELPVTFSSLRLLFIEKFAYSPGTDSFPEIYIQQSINDVPYELEEHLLCDVIPGSILSLNAQDHTAELVKGLESKVNTLQTSISKMQENLESTIKEAVSTTAANSSTAISTNEPTASIITPPSSVKKTISTNLNNLDVSDLRRELIAIKQISSESKKSFVDTLKELLEKVGEFKSSNFSSNRSGNRTYMETCHSKLSEDSDELLTKVDDLQDVVEALRKDVAQRGSHPVEDQLLLVKKDIDEAQKSINIMHQYIITEKPNWKSIWEKELDVVCEEQQFFKLQEDLVDDLKEDLEKASETFTLVEHVAKEHQKNRGKNGFKAPNLPLIEPGTKIENVRDAMLNEVVALRPNHQNRLEAIEKAEKVREKEKQVRLKNKFEEELNGFVDGNRLKKSGGIEETERIRKMKDEQNLKATFAVF